MSPSLPNTDTTITSEKQFVHFNDELTDSEAVAAVRIVAHVQEKYQFMTATKENLEAMRDELLTRLMEMNILAEVDPAPVLNGEPPVVEFIGKIAGDDIHKYGFDHEKKQWEIRKAREQGKDYLGEK